VKVTPRAKIPESPLQRRFKQTDMTPNTGILAEEIAVGRAEPKGATRIPAIDYGKARKLAKIKNIPTLGYFKTSHLANKPPIHE
jgi:hypothetical protein